MSDNAFVDTTRKFWIWLASEGGYSSASEVADAHRVERKCADRVLSSMEESGYVKRIRTAARANGVAYGVTAACRPPASVPQHVLDELGFVKAAA